MAVRSMSETVKRIRLFQQKYEDCSGDAIAEDWPDHFTDANGKDIAPLGSEDIDTLCERINR